MSYHELVIDGFEFYYSYGDGVIIRPSGDELNNPSYLEALKVACEAIPVVERFILLNEAGHRSFFGKPLNRAYIGDLKDVAEFYAFIKDHPLIDIPDDLRRFAIEVTEEYERRIVKHAKKAEKEAARALNAGGYVYLIQSPTGSYKIGRTVNPDDRMKTFSVKLPFEVEYICVIKTTDMYQLEAELHKRFASQRVNGEWFNLEQPHIEYVKSLAAQS